MGFKCHMVQEALQKDVSVTTYPAPKDGKYDVILPVGLPDEGAFDWLDLFHEKNPGYTELSDRMILDWAEKSGIWRRSGYGARAKTSNDKPEMNFGMRDMDDGSVSRVLRSVAPVQTRNYVIMEVKGSLMKQDRKEMLA